MVRRYTALLLLVILLGGVESCSGFMPVFTYDQLWEKSDIVVLGSVSSIETVKGWYTLKEFAVARYYKGDGASQIVVREEGGTLPDGSGVWVEDQPELSLRQTYLLFLIDNGDYLRVYGGPQGAFPVQGLIARGHSAYLLVSGEELEFVQDPSTRLKEVRCYEEAVVNEPVGFNLSFESVNGTGGHRLVTLVFRGVSGQAEGITLTKEVLGFSSSSWGFVPSYENFTVPGVYQLEVDGVAYREFDVAPPERDTPYRLTKMTTNSPVNASDALIITLDVEIGNSSVVEQRITGVVKPRTRGVEDYYAWYIGRDMVSDGEVELYCSVLEPGNYTLTVFVGGVNVLNGSFEARGQPVQDSVPRVAADAGSGEPPWWARGITTLGIFALAIVAFLLLRYLFRR